jgi:hypothetical protein
VSYDLGPPTPFPSVFLLPCMYSSPTLSGGRGWVAPNHTIAQKLLYLYTILTLQAKYYAELRRVQYTVYRDRICKRLRRQGIDSTAYLAWRNRFLGCLKVYKFGSVPYSRLTTVTAFPSHHSLSGFFIYYLSIFSSSLSYRISSPLFSFFLHRKKRFTSFPSPAGMSLTKLPLGRNNSVMTS